MPLIEINSLHARAHDDSSTDRGMRCSCVPRIGIVLSAVAAGRSPHETTVGELMTLGVVTVDEAADISTAMQVMMTQGVRRLAVLRDGSEIAGVLSLDDVIDALGRDWSMLTAILRGGQNRERTGSVQTPLHV